MKTRTIILISLCVVSVLVLFLIIGSGILNAPFQHGTSWPAVIIGALLLAFVLGAPKLDTIINEEPETRGLLYGILLVVFIVILILLGVYTLF